MQTAARCVSGAGALATTAMESILQIPIAFPRPAAGYGYTFCGAARWSVGWRNLENRLAGWVAASPLPVRRRPFRARLRASQHPLGRSGESAIPSFPRKRESSPSTDRLRRNRPEPLRPSWPPAC